MKRVTLLFIFLFISDLTFSQSNSINGFTTFRRSKEVVPNADLSLLDSNFSIVNYFHSDTVGKYVIKNIQAGTYILSASKDSLRSYDLHFLIKENDHLNFNLRIKDPCLNNSSNGSCPYCGTDKHVLPTAFGTVVSISFISERKSTKYDKKIRKKGYHVIIDFEGQESVVNVFNEIEKEKFGDTCFKWFCKKCKKVF